MWEQLNNAQIKGVEIDPFLTEDITQIKEALGERDSYHYIISLFPYYVSQLAISLESEKENSSKTRLYKHKV